ncbi:right-handed parallel beta-helix repeat-containing protein [Microvirga sp. VF16]|uniref:right-handed parallel beta-helix repeat-containing protein n=1 Tax=Microvirga sp. VF16 TaxID=2807101 RepID=UPI00193D33D9|nr:right-handed parallel beta-helix repeat-containing protein [Microvirga sp. VF16]QRM28047.1 right-handed parallel beta-helix repeat-containing protein [Microvirga sp. VF16]
MPTILVTNPTTNAADNVEKIKAAIEAAHQQYMADPSAGRVTVQLAAGTWVVTGDKNNASKGAIELLSGVELTGSGVRETVIKLEDGFNARLNGIVRTALETVDNVKVSNLVIDGNRANNVGHQAGFICGIKEDGSGRTQTNITIDGVEVMNCTAYGINPHEITYNMIVKNSIAHNNGLDGFVADAVFGGEYANNTSYDNDRHGFNIQNETKNLILRENVAYDNGYRYMFNGELAGGAGITIQRGNIPPVGSTVIPWVSDIQIIGGSYYNNGKEGILVKLSEKITITDADIFGNQRQGVRIEGSKNVTVDGSRIYNNSQEGDGLYDEVNIRLRFDDDYSQQTYYSLNTKIINNQIYSDGAINARYGVREEPTNDDNGPTNTFLQNNTFYGMNSGSVSVPGFLNPVVGTVGNDFVLGTDGGDEMRGLAGNDVYTVNHSTDVVIEQASEGEDHVVASVKFTLGANVEHLTLVGAAPINGTGNELANKLTGNAAVNELKGLGGNDILDGGAGDDNLQGGDGNDIYYVDSAGDVIVEKENLGAGGTDTVYTTASYTLSKDVENLVLSGSAHINAIGNASANVLTGNSGNNILDGQAGADLMTGGLGNDTYYVNHSGDTVAENADGGTDTVYSSISYVLAPNVENLILQGFAALNGTGNTLANFIVGNDGANKLSGGLGNDTLQGGLGDDTIDGGADTDTVVYAGTRASYALNGTLVDRTVSSAEGADTLKNVEIIQFSDGRLVGEVWQPGVVLPNNPGNPNTPSNPSNPAIPVETRVGSSRSENLLGNENINFIKGMGGNDVIMGRGADDRLYGGSGNDSINGGAGHDRLYGDAGKDRISGSTGDDTIYGGASNDTLYGNSGWDTFVFNTRLGTAKTDRAYNFDSVKDFNVTFDSFWLDNAVFKKLGSGISSNPKQLNKEFFVTGTKAREKDDYLIYNKKTGVLSYDADGSGSKEAVEFAQLSKNLKLAYKDFFVI